MSDRAVLDPENRALYGEILRAPSGYELDIALATTYTLDFETALVIPATLAFHAAESRQQTLDTPLALLEGLERLASRVAIFCEAGRIKAVPKGANRLTALLEETVTEVLAPRGGAFHPKLWVLRFSPIGGYGKTKLRLALLSRNLTTDTSWDLSLCLEGSLSDQAHETNKPIASLVSELPGLAAGRQTPTRSADIAHQLARDLEHARWQHPEHVRRISFAVNGLSEQAWRPRVGKKLAVISPFMTDGALTELTRYVAPEDAFLLGRAEEMALLTAETLARFGRVSILDELAETEDGEDIEETQHADVPARGLHAKAFVTERYSSTEITMGSGNATTAALLSGENVEVFATLSGYTRHLGTVEDQLSPERLGRYFREFEPYSAPDRTDQTAAERRLDSVRRHLATANLALTCTKDAENRISISLASVHSVEIPRNVSVRVWPLLAGSLNGVDIEAVGPQPQLLGRLDLKDVTRWIGIILVDSETGQEQSFTMGADLIGLPDERTAEILRSIIENREAFLKYIRLLLGDVSDITKGLFAPGSGNGSFGTFGGSSEAPILENMIRALSGDGRQLRDIERLVARLDGTGDDNRSIIPAEFLELWETFRAVLPDEETKRE